MIRVFRPLLAGATSRERLIAGTGAMLGIALTIVICARLPFASLSLPIIVAPMGASAVLVFAVPSSPLAQPWPVIGGNVISTLIGVVAFKPVPNQPAAAGIAVGAAILAMSALRCLHPPGGAAALMAVIGGSGVHEAGWSFAFVPVAVNSLTLVALAMVFHRLTTRSYPHRPAMATPATAGLHLADIDAALQDLQESFDISREDLDALLTRAEVHAIARRNRR